MWRGPGSFSFSKLAENEYEYDSVPYIPIGYAGSGGFSLYRDCR